MIIRNTEWSARFWKSVWEDFPEAINDRFWEQRAILLYRERKRRKFVNNAHIIPHRIMNTWKNEEKLGDFIIHAAGGHGGRAKYDELLQVYCEHTHLESCSRL